MDLKRANAMTSVSNKRSSINVDSNVEQQRDTTHDSYFESCQNSVRWANFCCRQCTNHAKDTVTAHLQMLIVCAFIFVVLTSAGIAVCVVVGRTKTNSVDDAVYEIAEDTGKAFSNELDLALLPLFSMAQFATEIDIFSDLPNRIGAGGAPGSLPFLPQVEGELSTSLLKRNVTGVCDDPHLIERFNTIVSTIESSTGFEDQIQTLQFSPYGVICLAYPYNNTEDVPKGKGLDNSKAIGLDLLNDQTQKFIAINSITDDDIKVSISGPRLIPQCPTCGLYIIARLPVLTNDLLIFVNDSWYNRWGFVTLLIHWESLINRTGQREKLQALGYDFQLTRTDYIFNDTSGVFDDVVFVLAESENYGSKHNEVSTALQTSNNEWVIKIQYKDEQDSLGIYIAVIIVVGLSISILVYCILVQKQIHTVMIGQNMAQLAKVDIERNITAYFAHELRNPLSAIDSALTSMPCSDPEENEELLSSMKLCSSFMTAIMNNLLDVRKLEEGKLVLHSDPFSLQQIVKDVRKMARPTLRPDVDFFIEHNVGENDCVLGDVSRINQILTNIVSNAVKYTLEGSITLAVGWDNDVVQFECRDTGPGIPKEDQSRMFERFVQRGGAPGSGLGLALVKQMVDLMSGTIHFDSDPTIRPGTTCVVRLPLTGCEMPLSSVSQTDELPIDEPLRILLVDDIKMNRIMLKRRLQKDVAPQCEIVEASTGEGALAICEKSAFDVIIMDQYMEEAGGILVGTDVIIALRRMKVPSVIIGCSGNDLSLEFTSAGADIVWNKPMPSNAEIIHQLRDVLLQRVQDSLRSNYKND